MLQPIVPQLKKTNINKQMKSTSDWMPQPKYTALRKKNAEKLITY